MRNAIKRSILNIRIQRKQNRRVNRGTEFHAEGGKISRVEGVRKASHDVDIGWIAAFDVQE